MKVLVTGASGFVGKPLVDKLKSQKYSVIAVSRSLDFNAANYVIEDINEKTDWVNLLKQIDVVIHLANRAHVIDEKEKHSYHVYKKTNVDATVNLAEQAIQSGVKRFIYLSSVKVNGEFTTTKPFDENDVPMPEDNYGKTKLEAEESLKALCQNSVMELVIIRPPLVYGVGVKANFLNLIKLCNVKIPLPFGAIHNKRSFIYIENLISFISICLTHPNAVNNTFLVSDNDDQSTTSLIKAIRVQLNKPIFLCAVQKRLLFFIFKIMGKKNLADRLFKNLQINSSKAQALLRWVPPYTFEEGIKKTIDGFKLSYD